MLIRRRYQMDKGRAAERESVLEREGVGQSCGSSTRCSTDALLTGEIRASTPILESTWDGVVFEVDEAGDPFNYWFASFPPPRYGEWRGRRKTDGIK